MQLLRSEQTVRLLLRRKCPCWNELMCCKTKLKKWFRFFQEKLWLRPTFINRLLLCSAELQNTLIPTSRDIWRLEITETSIFPVSKLPNAAIKNQNIATKIFAEAIAGLYEKEGRANTSQCLCCSTQTGEWKVTARFTDTRSDFYTNFSKFFIWKSSAGCVLGGDENVSWRLQSNNCKLLRFFFTSTVANIFFDNNQLRTKMWHDELFLGHHHCTWSFDENIHSHKYWYSVHFVLRYVFD